MCVFERVVCLNVLCEPITDVCVCVFERVVCVFERVV